jgi:hypothetical protein
VVYLDYIQRMLVVGAFIVEIIYKRKFSLNALLFHLRMEHLYCKNFVSQDNIFINGAHITSLF